MKKKKKAEKGLSLIEILISLTIFLIIVLASLEFFGFSRRLYLKLKTQEEEETAAFSALDRMKIDLLKGGAGLLEPIQLGLLEGIEKKNETLTILSKEKNLTLNTDLFESQTRIRLEGTDNLSRGREICIFDSSKGEVRSIASADNEGIVLSSPLNFSFQEEKTHIILMEKVSLFYDDAKKIIRRKANSSPSQPLLEEAALFDFDYEEAKNLARLRLALSSRREKTYEISVYPKNTALARRD